jgi:hypothetical protein
MVWQPASGPDFFDSSPPDVFPSQSWSSNRSSSMNCSIQHYLWFVVGLLLHIVIFNLIYFTISGTMNNSQRSSFRLTLHPTLYSQISSEIFLSTFLSKLYLYLHHRPIATLTKCAITRNENINKDTFWWMLEITAWSLRCFRSQTKTRGCPYHVLLIFICWYWEFRTFCSSWCMWTALTKLRRPFFITNHLHAHRKQQLLTTIPSILHVHSHSSTIAVSLATTNVAKQITTTKTTRKESYI